ncbi:MAG: acyl-CoA reductase [Ginsengibacter sp.]
MNLEERVEIMIKLGNYLSENENNRLDEIKVHAFEKNKWFTEEMINLALKNIASQYLSAGNLNNWVHHYHIDDNIVAKKVGIVMAGNIPLVGFHDFLCTFISGHNSLIKLSDKDDILMKHIIEILSEWKPDIKEHIQILTMLKDCEAYIATGSNNSSRYFEYYFGKYPSIIRKNKTSIAILTGKESEETLSLLADDVYAYFGLGCRNVTKIFIPEGYDFVPLLTIFKKYNYFSDHTKFRNNYDYNLSLLIMNNKFYMTNDTIILVESDNIFSPVSELHYSYYKDKEVLQSGLNTLDSIQCIVGEGYVPFGQSQIPSLFDYADGIDTMQFLLSI